MADFLYRRFRKRISERSIGRILRSISWTRTTIHRIAQQRNANLRDHYLHRISQYKPYQLVFVDKSGWDGRAGHRRWGWSPKGSSPVQVTKFSRWKKVAHSSSIRARWHHAKASISRLGTCQRSSRERILGLRCQAQ